jgi:hypothetical protein
VKKQKHVKGTTTNQLNGEILTLLLRSCSGGYDGFFDFRCNNSCDIFIHIDTPSAMISTLAFRLDVPMPLPTQQQSLNQFLSPHLVVLALFMNFLNQIGMAPLFCLKFLWPIQMFLANSLGQMPNDLMQRLKINIQRGLNSSAAGKFPNKRN